MADLTTIISQLEAQLGSIDRALTSLREISGGAPVRRGPGRPPKSASQAPASAPAPAKRRLSPEGRARIIEATKRRWAAQKKTGAKKRSGLTAEGRKRLSEAMKARWASKNPPKKRANA